MRAMFILRVWSCRDEEYVLLVAFSTEESAHSYAEKENIPFHDYYVEEIECYFD